MSVSFSSVSRARRARGPRSHGFRRGSAGALLRARVEQEACPGRRARDDRHAACSSVGATRAAAAPRPRTAPCV